MDDLKKLSELAETIGKAEMEAEYEFWRKIHAAKDQTEIKVRVNADTDES